MRASCPGHGTPSEGESPRKQLMVWLVLGQVLVAAWEVLKGSERLWLCLRGVWAGISREQLLPLPTQPSPAHLPGNYLPFLPQSQH